MHRNFLLLLVTTALSFFCVGGIWFTQLSCYPLWPLVGPSEFERFHIAWWHGIWWSFGPVGLMLLCSLAMLVARPVGVPGWALWVGVALQLVTHTLTVVWWAPIQARMATPSGMSVSDYQLLMETHWGSGRALHLPRLADALDGGAKRS